MSSQCSICNHPDIEAINEALARRVPHRAIASQYSANRSSVGRHKRNCLKIVNDNEPTTLVRSTPAPVMVGVIVNELADLRGRARDIEEDALDSDNIALALNAIREQARIMESLIKLTALISKSDIERQTSLSDSLEWVELRHALVSALRAYPEALIAVMELLNQ